MSALPSAPDQGAAALAQDGKGSHANGTGGAHGGDHAPSKAVAEYDRAAATEMPVLDEAVSSKRVVLFSSTTLGFEIFPKGITREVHFCFCCTLTID